MAAERGFTLPPRYRQWATEFWSFVDRALRPGAAILDLGAGRKPTIPPERRPDGTHYAGVDISAGELEEAPPGSYDEIHVADAQQLVPELVDRFDLIVAMHVLEHFQDLPRVASACHSYARPGGWFVSSLSGRYAAFSIANRILPDAIGSRVVSRLTQRPLETVFPAHYDHCTPQGLKRAFADWEEVHVIPVWHGGEYFARLPGIRAAYIRYENWARASGRDNLATHYVVAARKLDDQGAAANATADRGVQLQHVVGGE
jgi:SAM-dependent methyltransferase